MDTRKLIADRAVDFMPDGITRVSVRKGEAFDCPEHIAEGLIEEKRAHEAEETRGSEDQTKVELKDARTTIQELQRALSRETELRAKAEEALDFVRLAQRDTHERLASVVGHPADTRPVVPSSAGESERAAADPMLRVPVVGPGPEADQLAQTLEQRPHRVAGGPEPENRAAVAAAPGASKDPSGDPKPDLPGGPEKAAEIEKRGQEQEEKRNEARDSTHRTGGHQPAKGSGTPTPPPGGSGTGKKDK